MKVDKCPDCGSTDLGDRWTSGRKLTQCCHDDDCNWVGPARIPEKIPIRSTKHIAVSRFGGFEYEIYDRYGHTTTLSRTYSNQAEALKAMDRDLQQGEKSPDAGPYTGILWPATVEAIGKKFIVKKGIVTQVNV